MNESYISHISDNYYAYAVAKDTLRIRFKACSEEISGVVVHYKNLYNHTDEFFTKEMDAILCDGVYTLYEAEITLKERHFKYYFEIATNDGVRLYSADGIMEKIHESNCFYYPVINDDEVTKFPKWAEGGIIYQVITDRFFDGDKSNNPSGVKSAEELPDRNTYYGGDYKGIIEKLDYIKSLGANMIYISPAFDSPTYHKYDVRDYYKIEEIFGGKKGLKELVAKAHEKGMKIILDAVFNHCSIENELFKDVIKKGKASKYADWFIIDSFPVNTKNCNYDTFGGLVPSMPRFNTSNEEVIEYLTEAAVYWTKELKVDGWRLDVADEVSHSLWRVFRKKLKAAHNDVLLIGEVWNQALKWLWGDELDTVTNYKYRKWIMDFVSGVIDIDTLWNKLHSNKMLYRTPCYNFLINLIGSHDTIRSATLLDDDQLHTLTLVATLLLDGIPLIYYGDEIAMKGEEDPDNRRAMQWACTKENATLEAVREVGELRRASDVLKRGKTERLSCGERILAFTRELNGEKLTVIVNFGDERIKVKGNYKEMMAGEGLIAKDGILIGGRKYAVAK